MQRRDTRSLCGCRRVADPPFHGLATSILMPERSIPSLRASVNKNEQKRPASSASRAAKKSNRFQEHCDVAPPNVDAGAALGARVSRLSYSKRKRAKWRRSPRVRAAGSARRPSVVCFQGAVALILKVQKGKGGCMNISWLPERLRNVR